MKVRREGQCLIADIHGMRVEAARFRLQTLAESCGADIREIVVIHGYHGGQALKDMVREELTSPHIQSIRPALNEGQTVITLRGNGR